MKLKTIAPLISAAALLLGSASAHALIIDQFATGSQNSGMLTSGTYNNQNSSQATSGILGGYRDLILAMTQTGSNAYAQIFAGVPGSNYLSISNSANANSIAQVIWDGSNQNTALCDVNDLTSCSSIDKSGGSNGLTATDFTDNGAATGFYMFLGSVDQDVQITFDAWSSSSHVSSYTTPGLAGSRVGTNLFIPFASFTNPASSSSNKADFTKVTAFMMTVKGPSAYDTTIDYLKTSPQPVPEPATIAVLGVGLLGIAALRRRNKT